MRSGRAQSWSMQRSGSSDYAGVLYRARVLGMAASRVHSKEAEVALQDSVTIVDRLRLVRQEEQRLLVERRMAWLTAFSLPESAVTRERIAKACGCSIQLVDAELRIAREELANAAT